jgi:hypothetical protein
LYFVLMFHVSGFANFDQLSSKLAANMAAAVGVAPSTTTPTTTTASTTLATLNTTNTALDSPDNSNSGNNSVTSGSKGPSTPVGEDKGSKVMVGGVGLEGAELGSDDSMDYDVGYSDDDDDGKGGKGDGRIRHSGIGKSHDTEIIIYTVKPMNSSTPWYQTKGSAVWKDSVI